ncbi:MAG: NAD(P)/FAD-dependent oxidoreductase [Gammaproteobacteria bacterium]|jgi:putative flavoprotein involved in K+ transport
MTPPSSSASGPVARAVDTVVVGAGHNGLAMSRCLSRLGIDHVVLERGEIANSWRHERWDSLRLLTPSWQTRLPDLAYSGQAPDGFMTMPEVVEFIGGYAATIGAPIRISTEVRRVRHEAGRYVVETSRGTFRARALVLANGAFSRPAVPACGQFLPEWLEGLTSREYRNPSQLRDGGVLIVGASATGLQLAAEIQRSGRPVTLAVGEHIRMPRLYRGSDVQWWLSATGVLDQLYTDVEDIERARRVPSPQLVGTPSRETLDLNALQESGVRLVGRLVGVCDETARFSGSLPNHCAMADLKLNRLLSTFDEWADSNAGHALAVEPERPAATHVDARPPCMLNLRKAGISTVLWATGLEPDYGWLEVDVFDRRGRLRHDGGVVAAPGCYVMGLPFMRRRKSSYIHGAEDDATDLSRHLNAYLHGRVATDLMASFRSVA